MIEWLLFAYFSIAIGWLLAASVNDQHRPYETASWAFVWPLGLWHVYRLRKARQR